MHVVANENDQIQSFPRRLLDSRRPKRKPTAEEAEEWLIQYDPVLPYDPKRVLSHNYQVRFPSTLHMLRILSVLLLGGEDAQNHHLPRAA